MLQSCVCFGKRRSKRRSSSFEDSSSCRSSEIERGGELLSNSKNGHAGGSGNSILKFLRSKGLQRNWRKAERGMSMTKAERTMKAALLIQRWYRRYRARMEIRQRCTWNIFQSLEYSGEHDQVKLYDFFNALLIHIPQHRGTLGQTVSRKSSIAEDALPPFDDFSEEKEDEEQGHKPPVLKMPFDKKDITNLIDLFRKRKYNRLGIHAIVLILRESIVSLQRMPNLNSVSTAISRQITVIGDLHGKLDDLLVIFYKNGLPSPENPYIFNGDFVDRGKKSLEVFLLLLACLLAFPGGIFLNRGNHEDTVMNARYGFINEVNTKYPKNGEKLMKLIEEVYRWLPLGSIVNNRILIVHGGISDTTDLDLIKSLDRGKYKSILRPPITEGSTEEIDKTEWKQIFDIMWSDPQIKDGCFPNTLRGAGTYFGPDITQKFLAKYKLTFVIRSHECRPEGYDVMHNGKVITIFSASNYYAIGSNKGAYLKLDPHLEPHYVQYISQASKTKSLTFREKIGFIESSALKELGAKLRDNRDELESHFIQNDPKKTGKVAMNVWCEALERATKLQLPWRVLREKLAPGPIVVKQNGVTYVDYESTLELLDTDIVRMAQAEMTTVADSLYKYKSSLEVLFRILDKDGSGYISLDEFSDALDILQAHLPGHQSKEDLMKLCKLMDINKDGQVDLNEFLEAFRLCQKERESVAISRINHKRISIPSSPATQMSIRKSLQPPKRLAPEGDIDPADHDPSAVEKLHSRGQ
ncbi:PPEF1 family protein [Megaselia abdita]